MLTLLHSPWPPLYQEDKWEGPGEGPSPGGHSSGWSAVISRHVEVTRDCKKCPMKPKFQFVERKQSLFSVISYCVGFTRGRDRPPSGSSLCSGTAVTLALGPGWSRCDLLWTPRSFAKIQEIQAFKCLARKHWQQLFPHSSDFCPEEKEGKLCFSSKEEGVGGRGLTSKVCVTGVPPVFQFFSSARVSGFLGEVHVSGNYFLSN